MPQFLQLTRPPSLPPIFEMSRPEIKLAGLRVDPELYARSKMSYYTGGCCVRVLAACSVCFLGVA